MFSLYYAFYLPLFRYYCEMPLRSLWHYCKLVLNFRRQTLRVLSYLSLALIFVFFFLEEIAIYQPTVEHWARVLHCQPARVLVFFFLLVLLLACYLPARWRLSYLALLGSQCYNLLYHYLQGEVVYYSNEVLNLAVAKAGRKTAPRSGMWTTINDWVCAHPYVTAGIAFAVGVGITVVIYAITSHYGGDSGSKAELEEFQAFNLKCNARRPLTEENYKPHKDYLTYLPDGTVRPSTYEEVANGFAHHCRIARIPDTPIFRNDGLKTWENFEEDLKQFPLNTKMDLRVLVNQFRKSMDQIERETNIMHKILYCLFDGGENEAMVREFSYWDAKYTPLEHLAIVKTQSNETAIVFRGWLESFTYDDWKFNRPN